MKIMVTGVTGFIGRHVVVELLAAGHQVTAVARNAERAKEISWISDVCFLPCDIHNLKDDSVLANGVPDVVIHLAWPGLPNYTALSHVENTLPADFQFLKSLVTAGVKHLLISGTCFEYGMQSGCLQEEIATSPATPYALAKDCLHKFLRALQEVQPFCLQWARLFYMYGEGQNPNSLIAQLDRAIDAGDSVFNMSGGEQLRDYLPVESVASFLAALAGRPSFDGTVNICSGKPISVRRLVEEHIEKRQSSIRLNLGHYPYPKYEPMAFWGDSSKLTGLTQQ